MGFFILIYFPLPLRDIVLIKKTIMAFFEDCFDIWLILVLDIVVKISAQGIRF